MPKLNAVGSHSGVSDVLVKKTYIPAAKVKTLNTTAVTCVPNPGPGRAILFERALLNQVAGSTDYDQDCNLWFQYTGGTGDDVSQAQDDYLNDATYGTMMTVERIGTETAIQTLGYLTPNLAVELKATASPYNAAGNRDLIVTVFYRIVDIKY